MDAEEMKALVKEAIDFYSNALCPEDKRPTVDVMKKIIKLDEIKAKFVSTKKD